MYGRDLKGGIAWSTEGDILFQEPKDEEKIKKMLAQELVEKANDAVWKGLVKFTQSIDECPIK